MTRPARIALGLWLVLAGVIFSVTFDWQTRMSNHAFVRSQLARQRQGLPVATINDGFRPLVGAAARQSAVWFVLISVGGASATQLAARSALSERERFRSRESKG